MHEELIEQLKSNNRDKQVRAFNRLREIGYSAADGLAKLLEEENIFWWVKWAAIKIVGETKSEKYAKDVLPFLKHKHPEIRCAAAEALGNLRDKDSIPHLITLVGDKDASTSFVASESLYRLTGIAFGNDQNKWQAWWSELQKAQEKPKRKVNQGGCRHGKRKGK